MVDVAAPAWTSSAAGRNLRNSQHADCTWDTFACFFIVDKTKLKPSTSNINLTHSLLFLDSVDSSFIPARKMTTSLGVDVTRLRTCERPSAL